MGVSRTAQFLGYPLLLYRERVKLLLATNFKFCTLRTTMGSIGTAHKKLGKVDVGVVRVSETPENVQGTYIIGASRSRLCDSSAFLSY